MKKVVHCILIGFCMMFVTGVLARWWLTHPDVIPRFSEPVWAWLIDVYGSQNTDQLAELEVWVALSVSLLVVLLLTLGGWIAWGVLHKKRKSLSLMSDVRTHSYCTCMKSSAEK